jgi:hypothetical protein
MSGYQVTAYQQSSPMVVIVTIWRHVTTNIYKYYKNYLLPVLRKTSPHQLNAFSVILSQQVITDNNF